MYKLDLMNEDRVSSTYKPIWGNFCTHIVDVARITSTGIEETYEAELSYFNCKFYMDGKKILSQRLEFDTEEDAIIFKLKFE